MNEKELNKLVKEHYGFTIEELDNDVAYWCFRCSELQQENKELHNKIDKAIEFIKQAQYDDELKSYVYGLNATGTRKLLEILKESDVDE